MNETQVKQVVQKMLDNPDGITGIEFGDDSSGSKEYYFYFPKDKFFWSIVQGSNGKYGLFYYPSSDDRFNFLNVLSEEPGDFDQNLKNLFEIVHTRAYGFDDVLNTILDS